MKLCKFCGKRVWWWQTSIDVNENLEEDNKDSLFGNSHKKCYDEHWTDKYEDWKVPKKKKSKQKIQEEVKEETFEVPQDEPKEEASQVAIQENKNAEEQVVENGK